MAFQFVYMTTGSLEEAQRIGEVLVKEKLAACVNILDAMQSLYIWDGALQKDREVVMIAKTARARVPELVARVKTLHSYDCPCIVTFEIDGGNADFLQWIGAAVRPGD
ncbi:MAG: divalent-cation tolerance protein CutA [Desulfosarcina sp.]|nr:divalent-cation tolerance protein CutA [Desulfobacterales bacterium]